MMDFIPDAQTLLIVVQGVDTGKPGYDKEKLIDAELKYFNSGKYALLSHVSQQYWLYTVHLRQLE